MNWDAVGAIGEVGGAIAVVVTLVYLARQIRHNSESTLASTQIAVQAEFNRMHEVLVQDRDLLRTLNEVQQREALDAVDDRVFHHYANRLLNQWIAIQKAKDHGAIDYDFYIAAKEDVVRACELWPGLDARLREALSHYSNRWKIFEALYETAGSRGDG
jgi:hypothetical protein